jgi:Golgi nucleoside diphosphatase
MMQTNLGEEEAIYSWTAINFLKGDLLSESKGVGPATGGKEGTFGTLDLGGASSQIAFYVKNQGIFLLLLSNRFNFLVSIHIVLH